MAKPKAYSMPRGKLKNLSINELSGVDRPCQAPATVALMKRAPPPIAKALFERVLKQAVLTDEVDGHQHTIDLCDPACGWRDSYSTSSQTAAGAQQPHSHAWTYDPATGAVIVAADSGHSHTVSALVPGDVRTSAVLSEAASRQQRAKTNAVNVAEAAATGTVAVTVAPIELRAAPEVISTPAQPAATVVDMEQLAALRKMLTTALALPEPQRAYVTKLAPGDQEVFLGLDAAARDAAVKAADAADPVVYTTKGGVGIRKSHGELAEAQAKQLDTQSDQLTAAADQIAKANAAAAQVTIEKRAVDLIPLIGKSLAERVAIIKAVDAIADEAIRNGAIEALKGANNAFRLLGVPCGTDGGGAPPNDQQPLAKFNAGLTEFAKSVGKAATAATADFLRTPTGAQLYVAAFPYAQ